jgi:polysaccharide deacetylase 2 family uncharacterized protein YibQ
VTKIPRALKIALSAAFVVLVAFLVVRAFLPKNQSGVTLGPAAPHKKVVTAPKKPVSKKSAKPRVTEKEPVVTGESGVMAIILDDWGANYGVLRQAIAIRRPLTLAVLPDLEHSRRIAEEAHRANLEVILHMPMEPKNSGRVDLEPETIMTTTSDADILRYLDRAVASVPHLDGVNNHMGSAATSDARVMRTILKHLKKKGLFFIDSNTIATTVAPAVAAETGIRFTKRDVFIDNEPEVDAIKAQLRIAAKKALAKGRVVVIGHDKASTLRAIAEMVDELEAQGIEFVYARDLVKVAA